MSKEIILKCNKLNKEFDKKIKDKRLKALKDVDLEVYEDEILGLVGESGCGKSTLAKTIVQLIEPDSGSIFFKGEDIVKLSSKEKRILKKDMQYIFQDPKSALNNKKTIGWLLEEPLKVHTKMSKIERKERVKEMLDLVGLSYEYIDRHPYGLSGGQAQRIAILCALINKPSFVIADEAVSALDVSIQAQILNFLQCLKKEMNVTMIFITHDLSVCHYMSDRIAVMYSGRIVEIGDADTIYTNPKHPYTQELFQSILTIHSKLTDFKTNDVEKLTCGKNGCEYAPNCSYKMEKCINNLPDEYKTEDGSKVRCFLYENKIKETV